MIQFNRRYFVSAVVLFLVEVLIAVYMHDNIIRSYGGDVLVVILLYCVAKNCLKVSVWKAAISVLILSFVIEVSQYFHFVRLLGLQHSALANTVLGNYFHWIDLVSYTLGIAIVLWAELILVKHRGLNYYHI